IGAGEVSAEELDPSFSNGNKISHDEKVLIEAEFKTADQIPNVNVFVQEIIDSLKEKDVEVNKKNVIRASWELVTLRDITEEFHHEVVSWCKVNCPQDPNEVIE
ncbi:MAG: hypothetical protein J6T69_07865, partial [Methanobrevibacter sp.]|nr:hypothetical protein [Methanobrevibacter sp.]